MNDSELLQKSFRICLQCGYWSYSDEKCYLDESELISISDTQGETRSPGTEMTSPSGIEFVWIPPGSFMMGSPESEEQRSEDEGPQRLVTLLQGFWMGKYEVTQGQYESVMEENPSDFSDSGEDFPVEQVSWHDAKEFIMRLNASDDGFIYSLPTEAEWEYAARAGSTSSFAFGPSLYSIQANIDWRHPFGRVAGEAILGGTTTVGNYKPNAWGVHDMHGNVWEWVEDIYNDSYRGLPTDGSANTAIGDGLIRVMRGGSWYYGAKAARSACRAKFYPELWLNHIGFRVGARARNQSSVGQ